VGRSSVDQRQRGFHSNAEEAYMPRARRGSDNPGSVAWADTVWARCARRAFDLDGRCKIIEPAKATQRTMARDEELCFTPAARLAAMISRCARSLAGRGSIGCRAGAGRRLEPSLMLFAYAAALFNRPRTAAQAGSRQ
jgi:hypothetical protein